MAKRSVSEGEKAKLELMLQLHNQGVNIGNETVAKLIEAGLIQQNNEKDTIAPLDNGEAIRVSLKLFTRQKIVTSKKQTEADKHITIVYTDKEKNTIFLERERSVSEKIFKKEIAGSAIYSGEEQTITEQMWRPESKVKHSKQFTEWIDSVSRPDGFWNSKFYKPYELYCRQSEQWLQEPPPEIKDEEELFNYRITEASRCKENSLYAVDKYGELKEASSKGMHKYISAKAHKVLLYLLDCGYSMDIIKARQIAFTTTIAFWVLIKAMFNFNFNAKYLSENKIKAEDTLENKIKYAHSKFPIWLQPEARNDRIQRIVFGEKGEKGEREGLNSSVEVLPPGKTAIASTTPDATLIDEAGNIDILSDILSDNLPTQYGYNPDTGDLELLRQIIIWGTGGYMEKAGVAFKAVFMAHLESWNEKNFDSGIIPIFFNNWWKPGMTKAIYERLKKEAYAAEGPTAVAGRIRFHQGFPITIEDVFLQGGKTLLDGEFIQKNLDRISGEAGKVSPYYGYFEPIYDIGSPAHEGSDVPYKIIGSNWVPCSIGDDRVTTMIFLHPKKWKNRYYQGTDPIASDNGHSKMSSVIWDKHFGTPVACLNFRTDNYRYVFQQTVLLGIYYDAEKVKGAVPELIESNIGTAYREYKDNKGLGNTFVYSSELPQILQTKGGTVLIGVDNKGLRNPIIIGTLRNVFETFGERMWLPVFFNQLKTFTCKQKGNGETWEPMDKRYNRDDTLFALVYSYLCAECYSRKNPEELEGPTASKNNIAEHKLTRDRQGNLKYITKNEYNRIKSR